MKVDLAPARVRGFRFAGVSAGLKTQAGAKDLGLIAADHPCPAAAVFSANKVKAAPVYATIDRIRSGRLQAIVANSGCANSFTGKPGLKLAEDSCAVTARELGCAPSLVAPSSTGVIGHLYDLAKFSAGVREAAAALSEDGLADFARAIMTTDTRPKTASTSLRIGGADVTIAGAVKGVGMISPHMATMLAYIMTDAAASAVQLRTALKLALPQSFNAITVDGDMSTNDTVIVMASGAAGNRPLRGRDLAAFNQAIAARLCGTRARAGARRRGRDQAGRGPGARRAQFCRRRAMRPADRKLAAGQNRVLRMRPERRANPDGGGIVGRGGRV